MKGINEMQLLQFYGEDTRSGINSFSQRWNRVGILTRWPDPTRTLSVVKQILDSGLIAVSVTCQETHTV